MSVLAITDSGDTGLVSQRNARSAMLDCDTQQGRPQRPVPKHCRSMPQMFALQQRQPRPSATAVDTFVVRQSGRFGQGQYGRRRVVYYVRDHRSVGNNPRGEYQQILIWMNAISRVTHVSRDVDRQPLMAQAIECLDELARQGIDHDDDVERACSTRRSCLIFD